MNEHLRTLTRRHFFQQSGLGIGSLALSSLLDRDLFAQAAPRNPHFAPKAKDLIFLSMAGAPSQLAPFGYKPTPTAFDRKPGPAGAIKGARFASMKGVLK